MSQILPTLFFVLMSVHFHSTAASGYRGFNDVHTMPLAISDMTATVFPATAFSNTGLPRIYVVGGCDTAQKCPKGGWCFCPSVTNKCNYYTPGKDTWTACADAPRARYRHAAVALNKKLYLFGGRDATDKVIKEVDVFDPISNSWSSSPMQWPAACSDLAAFTEGAHIYLVGGWSAAYAPLNTLIRFTPNAKAAFQTLAPMTNARGDLSAISVPVDHTDLSQGSYHYVLGGFAQDTCHPLNAVESYDVATNKWVTRKNLTLARGDMAVGHIHNHAFVIAGETKDATCAGANPGNSIPVSDVERLDQSGSTLGSWVVEENVPANRFRFVGASYGEEIFLFGGQGPLNTSSREHPVLQTTMLYVPRSVADARDEAAKIAAIVVAAVVVAGVVLAALMAYGAWARCQGYSAAPDAPDGQEPTSCGANPEVHIDSLDKKEDANDVTKVDIKAEVDVIKADDKVDVNEVDIGAAPTPTVAQTQA